MSVIALVSIDHPVLSDALAAEPEVSLSLVQETLPADRPARLIFWAEGGDHETFERALEADSSVARAVRLARSDARTLYRIDVAEACESEMTYPTLADLDIALLDSEADADGWLSRLHAPDRPSLQRYIDYCRGRDMSITVERLYMQTGDDGDDSRLTPGQREVLELALEEDYFEIPRGITTHELGDRLDVSGQAVSERLRRGLRKTVTRTLDGDDGNGA